MEPLTLIALKHVELSECYYPMPYYFIPIIKKRKGLCKLDLYEYLCKSQLLLHLKIARILVDIQPMTTLNIHTLEVNNAQLPLLQLYQLKSIHVLKLCHCRLKEVDIQRLFTFKSNIKNDSWQYLSCLDLSYNLLTKGHLLSHLLRRIPSIQQVDLSGQSIQLDAPWYAVDELHFPVQGCKMNVQSIIHVNPFSYPRPLGQLVVNRWTIVDAFTP